MQLSPNEKLKAIKALVNGEWDNPALNKLGPLTNDTDEIILQIINTPEGEQTTSEDNHTPSVTVPELLYALETLLISCEGASLPKNMAIHLTEAKDASRAIIARSKGEHQ